MTLPPHDPRTPPPGTTPAPPAPSELFAGLPAPSAHHAAPTAPRNPVGLIAFIVGLVSLGIGLMQMIAQAFVVVAGDYAALTLWGTVFAILGGLLAVGVIALGLAGVLARDRPKALAGIGLGIGIAGLVNVISSALIYPALIAVIAG